LPLKLASFGFGQNVASENPHRIRTATDVGGSKQQRV
jgi:hypothetical protein